MQDTAGVFDTQMKKIEMEGTRRKGYFKQTRMLKAAVKTAWSAVRTSDVVFWVIDAWKLPSYGGHLPDVPMLDGIPIGDPLPFAWWSHPELMDEMYLIQRLSSRKKKVPVQVVLNKMDLGTLDDGTPIVQNIWPTSALTDDSSLDPIRTWLCENLPEQSPIFPLDSVSDVSAKVIAAEITREWLFKDARAEVPYQTNVVTVIWKELENGTLKLGQKVIVRKKSHALICKGVLRKINRDVEQETSETLNFGRPVELHFQISVEPDWENNPVYYDEVQGILSQTASLQYK
jgi:GTPase Era involved in 16S rRNA processing